MVARARGPRLQGTGSAGFAASVGGGTCTVCRLPRYACLSHLGGTGARTETCRGRVGQVAAGTGSHGRTNRLMSALVVRPLHDDVLVAARPLNARLRFTVGYYRY